MQKTIRTAATTITLLFFLSANFVHAQTPQVLQQTQQLLDWLGVLALLEQAPTVLDIAVEAEAKLRESTPQQREAWHRELEPKLKPAVLQQTLIRYVAERYRAETFSHNEELLQQPLARRARYFDLAMTQASAVQGLQDYRALLSAKPQPNRRALIQELDAATATSLLAAILQTGVGDRVRQLAGGTEKSASAAQEFVERQRFLAPFTEDYLLYAYRYFKDEELSAYRDLLRDAELQWFLDVSRQGLIAALQVTP
ncbi:MAG TPA: hypothetical protein VLC91_02905 [Spongiibacteraceae bacterium]|nr:hypothetical protein [Spongiibacteraceae bacterium]